MSFFHCGLGFYPDDNFFESNHWFINHTGYHKHWKRDDTYQRAIVFWRCYLVIPFVEIDHGGNRLERGF
jgi:hypothetical protein